MGCEGFGRGPVGADFVTHEGESDQPSAAHERKRRQRPFEAAAIHVRFT